MQVNKMKILILGAGAVGGYFGGRLVQSGADVTFLVRQRRLEELSKNGLVIYSPHGNLKLKVKTVLSSNIKEKYDLIILTCKAYSLESAIEDLKPAVGPNTFFLPLMNGLSHYRLLDNTFKSHNVLGGFCFVNTRVNSKNEIEHFTKQQKIVFGPRNEQNKPFCVQLKALLEKASFEHVLSNDIYQDIWEKFIFLTSAASITCLMRADIKTIFKLPYGEEVIKKIFNESISVGESYGHVIKPEMMAHFNSLLLNPESSLRASMLSDIENNKHTEADQIIGEMIKHAIQKNIDVPLLKTAYCHIKSYENGL